jgi:hypothetical protein
MKTFVTGILTALLALSLALPAAAGKKCKEGKVYDPETRKCVTDRGS